VLVWQGPVVVVWVNILYLDLHWLPFSSAIRSFDSIHNCLYIQPILKGGCHGNRMPHPRAPVLLCLKREPLKFLYFIWVVNISLCSAEDFFCICAHERALETYLSLRNVLCWTLDIIYCNKPVVTYILMSNALDMLTVLLSCTKFFKLCFHFWICVCTV